MGPLIDYSSTEGNVKSVCSRIMQMGRESPQNLDSVVSIFKQFVFGGCRNCSGDFVEADRISTPLPRSKTLKCDQLEYLSQLQCGQRDEVMVGDHQNCQLILKVPKKFLPCGKFLQIQESAQYMGGWVTIKGVAWVERMVI